MFELPGGVMISGVLLIIAGNTGEDINSETVYYMYNHDNIASFVYDAYFNVSDITIDKDDYNLRSLERSL